MSATRLVACRPSTAEPASARPSVQAMCEAGEGEAAAALLDEHLGRARERLVAAFGGEAGPEADVPSDLVSQ